MNNNEARLHQINFFLGDGIVSLLEKPNCKLYFESNGEVNAEGKETKPCILYIIANYLLVCRPRKFGKKYYIKYQLPVQYIHVEEDDLTGADTSSNLILTIRNQYLSCTRYFIRYVPNILFINLVSCHL